jgi:L-threonylcarbamoyladenylate synthase
LKAIDKVWTIDPHRPDRRTIEKVAGIVSMGGVVVFPTRGLYGLGADSQNPQAVKRVFDLKGRDYQKPLLVLIAGLHTLDTVSLLAGGVAVDLMRHFWPGKVTFVIPARKDLSPLLTGGSQKIGVRVPGHPVAAALVGALGRPLTGTSANLSGEAGCTHPDRLDPGLVGDVDGVLDAGPLRGGSGSTVVDICGDVPRILREGAVSASEIMAAFGRYSPG